MPETRNRGSSPDAQFLAASRPVGSRSGQPLPGAAGNGEAVKKQLSPDQETFQREEQRRFEVLEAHWYLPLVDVDLEP